MKRVFQLVSLLFFLCFSRSIQAQTKPALTVLPFTSENGSDEETLTVLVANHEDIRNAFMVIPFTDSFSHIKEELAANPTDTVRNRFNADLAVIIQTKKIRNANVAFFSLINVETLQLVTGDYRLYYSVRELRPLLPEIVKNLTAGTQRNQDLPKLTVMPVYTALSREEAEILAQTLAIELANSGIYAVFPWDVPIKTGITEPKMPYSGVIDPDFIIDIGKKTESQYILTGDILSMGTANLFRTAIVQTDEGNFVSEENIEYRNIPEELDIIPVLVSQLLNIKEDIAIMRDPPLPTVFPEIGRTEEQPAWETPAESSKNLVQAESSKNLVQAESLKNLVRIEGGTFIMGSPASEVSRDRDEVQHEVVVSSFYIGKYEVTQQEYEAVMGTNPSYFKGSTRPVEQVSWFDAVVYCNALSIKEGLASAYTIREEEIIWNHSANGYRLPTEEEWEYACRAGTKTTYNIGDNITTGQVNYDGNYPYNKGAKGTYRRETTSVGSFEPNAWGLHDMHGNVYEWCWDQYNTYTIGGLNGSMLVDAVIRGGSWYSEARFLRSANRVRAAHDARAYYIGFRVVRSIVQP